jgi:hypothetical protein
LENLKNRFDVVMVLCGGGGVYVCKYSASQQFQQNFKWWISRTGSRLEFGQVVAANWVLFFLGLYVFESIFRVIGVSLFRS